MILILASIAASSVLLFVCPYFIYRETRRVSFTNFSSWNVPKQVRTALTHQYFVVIVTLTFFMQLFSIFMVLQCHGENTLQLGERQQFISCSTTAMFYVFVNCFAVSMFELAVLYRYQRLLAIRKGSIQFAILTFIRHSLITLAVLIIFTYGMIVAFLRYDYVLVLDTNSVLELVVKVLFLGMVCLFGNLTLISDIYFSFQMIRRVMLTSAKIAKLQRSERGAALMTEIWKKLASFLGVLILCATLTIVDIFTGFSFLTQVFIQ